MPPIDMIPVESLAELQPEVVYALAISNLPQQKINELRIKSAQKLVQISKAQLYPSISAFGSMATNYANNKIPSYSVTPLGTYSNTGAIVNVGGNTYQVQQPDFKTNITTSVKSFSTQFGDNFRQNVGIGLSIPIFNAGQAKTAYQRSKLNVESVQLVKEQGERTLKQDIYRSYNDAVNSLQKFNATKKSVETAEKAYNFAQKRYELGLLTTVDYLTNQNNLTRAKIERALAQVDYVFRLKLLEFYKGKGMKL
jgi:outer membrane protein